jgi:hypothetical protein
MTHRKHKSLTVTVIYFNSNTSLLTLTVRFTSFYPRTSYLPRQLQFTVSLIHFITRTRTDDRDVTVNRTARLMLSSLKEKDRGGLWEFSTCDAQKRLPDRKSRYLTITHPPITMRILILTLAATTVATTAYQPSNTHRPVPVLSSSSSPATAAAAAAVVAAKGAAAAALASAFLFTAPFPAFASDAAAQISLQSLPPTSISIQIGDLPVVGSLLSGTYTKVPDGSIAKPSVVIKSPVDKVKAISSIATGGHLEFDVNGKINTHLDVDVAADEAGTARVLVRSNLIPRLPFRNMASASASVGALPTGGKESQWNIVTNLGNGDSYYYNVKTGVTQYDRPDKI